MFSKTELDLIRSAYRLNHFTHSTNGDYMILLLNQLKKVPKKKKKKDESINTQRLILSKAFQIGRLSEAMIVIQYMKNIESSKIRSTSTDYQILDLLEYM